MKILSILCNDRKFGNLLTCSNTEDEDILNKIVSVARNISRQYFESAKCFLLTVYGKIKIDELKKDLLGFQVEYGRNISNPKITGLENTTHPQNPSSQNIFKENENLEAMPSTTTKTWSQGQDHFGGMVIRPFVGTSGKCNGVFCIPSELD